MVNTNSGNYNVTGGTAVGAASATGWTADDLKDTNYTYFAIKKSSGVSYVSSIEIVYEEKKTETCTAPVIVDQPTSKSVVVGTAAEFTVNATGNNLTYQWQAYDESAKTWGNIDLIDSAKTKTYSISETEMSMNGSKFRVVISSDTCTTTSDEVTLTVTQSLAVDNLNVAKGTLVKNTVVSNEIIFGQAAKVSIISMNGQVVKTADVLENGSLNVSQLAKGIYIVTATVNGKTISQKIVKK
ncbi:T9SS type A sorting domain-containing protein [Chryseobacterium sp. T1]